MQKQHNSPNPNKTYNKLLIDPSSSSIYFIAGANDRSRNLPLQKVDPGGCDSRRRRIVVDRVKWTSMSFRMSSYHTYHIGKENKANKQDQGFGRNERGRGSSSNFQIREEERNN